MFGSAEVEQNPAFAGMTTSKNDALGFAVAAVETSLHKKEKGRREYPAGLESWMRRIQALPPAALRSLLLW